MIENTYLKNHLETSQSIEIGSVIYGEINLNESSNINVIGNYRNRPVNNSGTISNSLGNALFIVENSSTASPKYYGATDSDIVVDGGIGTNDVAISYASTEQRKKLTFSLEDCFLNFRPRSGINKAVSFGTRMGHYIHNTSSAMMLRPRYYLADKNDNFKYWTSFRKEVVASVEYERGIANKKVTNNEYLIDDAVPFVVYKDKIPTNRIVLKMQTHVGTYALGTYFDGTGYSSDPLYDPQNTINNRTVPINWSIQYLDAAENGAWQTLKSFTSGYDNSVPIIGRDGYLELRYTPSGWVVNNESFASPDHLANDFIDPVQVDGLKYEQFQYIYGLRVVVNTMSKVDSTFDLIEISPRLAVNFSDITTDYSIKKIASDLGASGMPVGQLLASTGTLSIADYEQVLNPESGSIIADYVKRNTQIKLYEAIKNVAIEGGVKSTLYVPIKTMYVDKFPELNGTKRTATITMRDLYSYFESIQAPEIVIENTSLSYALAMIFDSIGFSNYVYKKSNNDTEPQIPHFFVSPNTTVAQVLQDLAMSTQSAMFFDEFNNFVIMSKSYMLAKPGDRLPNAVNKEDEVSLTFRGQADGTKQPNIRDIASKRTDPFNGGRINYKTRYIQKSYTDIRKAEFADEEKIWYYKPALLWEVAPNNPTKSINEQRSSSAGYSLSAIPLNSSFKSVRPSVVNGAVVDNVIDLGEGIHFISRYNGYFYANGEIIKFDAVEYSVSGIGATWVTSVEQYQDLFSKIPFGGKLYATGRVRIYSEPYYNENGTLKNGPVAKDGREQFNTSMPSGAHHAGIGNGHWVKTNINGFSMGTKYVTQTPSSSTFSVTTTKRSLIGKDVIRISPNDKLKVVVGQVVTSEVPADGYFAANTKVKNKDVDGGFQIDKPLLKQLPKNKKVIIKGISVPDSVTDPGADAVIDVDPKAPCKTTIRTSIIRNFLSSQYNSETQIGNMTSAETGTVQSSAFVFSGPTFEVGQKPIDYISYVYKNLGVTVEGPATTPLYNHIGTRMRIVGQRESDNETFQSPTGAMDWYNMLNQDPAKNTVIKGSSGGLGILMDPYTSTGYYLELAALNTTNIEGYTNAEEVANVLFYRIGGKGTSGDPTKRLPIKLWSGLSQILVDDGRFTGQYRVSAEKSPTVYDIAVEYEVQNNGNLKFYLYLNNQLVGSVIDPDPLPLKGHCGLFIRGTSRVMFENIYAVKRSESANFENLSDTPLNATLSLNKETSIDESYRKYTLPESISNTYLSGISPLGVKTHDIFFEEFGTIMREAAYFNIKYDKAYPALAAQIAPTFNKLKGYAVGGFVAGAYGAEFLIFNTSDRTIALDSKTGNYLRILGVTFTQESTHDYTVDEYYNKHSDFSNPSSYKNSTIANPMIGTSNYNTIKDSRMTYGRKDFNITAPYIQSQDAAEELMAWVTDRLTTPKLSVGLDIFGMPTLQIGDLVHIDYSADDVNAITDPSKRFVVYSIDYARGREGIKMTAYVSEVV